MNKNEPFSLKPRMLGLVIAKARSLFGRTPAISAQDILGMQTERPARDATGAVLTLVSLIAVVACVGAAMGLTQIRSLKSEIAALHRELAAHKERIAQLEQATHKPRDKAEQQQAAQDKPGIERNVRSGTTPTALNLSAGEAQLVREYIKTAPSAGAHASAVRVGDTVDGATIPLPSPLVEQVPKLVGARFTIQNGAIIIIRKDSRQADAVLAPN